MKRTEKNNTNQIKHLAVHKDDAFITNKRTSKKRKRRAYINFIPLFPQFILYLGIWCVSVACLSFNQLKCVEYTRTWCSYTSNVIAMRTPLPSLCVLSLASQSFASYIYIYIYRDIDICLINIRWLCCRTAAASMALLSIKQYTHY